MTDIFQGDPAIEITRNGAKLVFIGGQPVMDSGLQNQALISLFTEKGWPGNHLFDNPDNKIGSDFEKLARGPITLSRLSLIEKTAELALKSDIFGTVTAVATNPESWRIDLMITIEPPSGDIEVLLFTTNGQNWISQALNPAFERLNKTITPSSEAGISYLYHCDSDTDKIYKLDPDTMLDISGGGVNSPSTLPFGVGGIINHLYHCDANTKKIYELDLDTMLDISGGGVNSPGTFPLGIGGTANRLYHCDANTKKIYELDLDTMLDISAGGVNSPSTQPFGIGGTTNRLYHCDTNTDKIYELDPDTMLDISAGGVNSPSISPQSVGGTTNRLYHCDTNTDKIYELDLDTMLDISGGGVNSPGISPLGIGGTK